MGQQIAFVIHPDNKRAPLPRPPELCLIEACGLVEAIGVAVHYTDITTFSRPKAGTFIGSGYADMLKERAEIVEGEHGNPLIVINCNLAPVQQRNLEVITGCKVIDRTALILEIFGARATTHAGRLQVELAALTFQRSRLVRSWTHLERQRGGGGFLGGPGERQIELDRRMLMQRVDQIKKELADVERTRLLQRQNRNRTETPTLALIGYTNAGKSTFFNSITGAAVLSKDMLFATLDPTMRAAVMPSGRKIVLADTVGFISQLPTELIEAFKSTLEEVLCADMLIHVHDASSELLKEEADDVRKVLLDIGMTEDDIETRVIHVVNKIDSTDAKPNLLANAIPISALTGAGIDRFYQHLEARLSADEQGANIKIQPHQGEVRAWLYRYGRVNSAKINKKGVEMLNVTLSIADHARFVAKWPEFF
ncbi:MAG: GTPase HflX [Candidatus Puniceispirillales bacterium WSBS_2018_MAG_OTU23]